MSCVLLIPLRSNRHLMRPHHVYCLVFGRDRSPASKAKCHGISELSSGIRFPFIWNILLQNIQVFAVGQRIFRDGFGHSDVSDVGKLLVRPVVDDREGKTYGRNFDISAAANSLNLFRFSMCWLTAFAADSSPAKTLRYA